MGSEQGGTSSKLDALTGQTTVDSQLTDAPCERVRVSKSGVSARIPVRTGASTQILALTQATCRLCVVVAAPAAIQRAAIDIWQGARSAEAKQQSQNGAGMLSGTGHAKTITKTLECVSE